MIKKTILLSAFLLVTFVAFSQQKPIEQIVADSACTCLQEIDINLPKEKLAAQADSCMLLAIEKNITLIEKQYDTENKDAYQDGVQYGQKLAQKALPFLAKDCKSYIDILHSLKQH